MKFHVLLSFRGKIKEKIVQKLSHKVTFPDFLTNRIFLGKSTVVQVVIVELFMVGIADFLFVFSF